MSMALVSFSIILVLLWIAFGFLILRHFRQNANLNLQQRMDQLQNQLRINLDGNTQILQQQLGILTKQLDDRLGQSLKLSGDTGKQINERMDNAARVIGEVQNRLGKLAEASEKIYHVGKDISSLQEILRSPKSRGSIGELFLETLLAEMLPRDRFNLQHGFKNNEKVDAVILVGDRLLPIDSKFALENFKRLVEAQDENDKKTHRKQFLNDIKKHVDSIAKKYILPEEGTFDFAFMYIPAENVFYEVIIREVGSDEESLQAYALKKRVILVSPNSFYAYLGALMHALRGERVQKNIVEVTAQLRHLMVELGRFREDFDKIGHHLNNLKNCYESSEKRLGRYTDRLERIQNLEQLDESERAVKLVSN